MLSITRVGKNLTCEMLGLASEGMEHGGDFYAEPDHAAIWTDSHVHDTAMLSAFTDVPRVSEAATYMDPVVRGGREGSKLERVRRICRALSIYNGTGREQTSHAC